MIKTYVYTICSKQGKNNYRKQLATVVLTVVLENNYNKPILRIRTRYKRGLKVYCGQCLGDILSEFPTLINTELGFWYKMWKAYHLNDMHAGTKRQEEALLRAKQRGELSELANYSERCAYLKQVGLYEVTYHNKPYRYGSAWLYRAIQKEDLQKLESALNTFERTKTIIIGGLTYEKSTNK